jgi:hypothetical protein
MTMWQMLAISNPSYGSLALWNIPQRPVLGTHNQVASLRWRG